MYWTFGPKTFVMQLIVESAQMILNNNNSQAQEEVTLYTGASETSNE